MAGLHIRSVHSHYSTDFLVVPPHYPKSPNLRLVYPLGSPFAQLTCSSSTLRSFMGFCRRRSFVHLQTSSRFLRYEQALYTTTNLTNKVWNWPMVRCNTVSPAPGPNSSKVRPVPLMSTPFLRQVRHDHFHTHPSGGDRVPYRWWHAA